jgi:nucleotide-binding universal stress UspA family protein
MARQTKASVTIVDVLPPVPDKARAFVTDGIEQELVDARRQRLEDIARTRGGRVDTKLIRGAPAVALSEEVERSGFDLLVRGHGVKDKKPRPFGPIDMGLLRHCPCPVWLVGPTSPTRPRPRRIAAAIDAGCNTAEEAALNRAILRVAMTVGAAIDADVTAVYVWAVFGAELLDNRMTEAQLAEYVAGAEAAARADLDKFTGELDAGETRPKTALLEGDPQEKLPAYLHAHHIDVVVMGTIARGGLAGYVIGNTAERMLSALRESVLAIKPEGWKRHAS